MKLFLFLLFLLPLATSALPLFAPKYPPSPVNSFGSSGSLSSECRSKKHSFLTKSACKFSCYSNPDNSILGELSAYITDLLRSNREQIFGKQSSQQGPAFKTCNAGFEISDVAPSIYFEGLKAKQMKPLKTLLKSSLSTTFPDVEIVKESDVIAVVMGRL